MWVCMGGSDSQLALGVSEEGDVKESEQRQVERKRKMGGKCCVGLGWGFFEEGRGCRRWVGTRERYKCC